MTVPGEVNKVDYKLYIVMQRNLVMYSLFFYPQKVLKWMNTSGRCLRKGNPRAIGNANANGGRIVSEL